MDNKILYDLIELLRTERYYYENDLDITLNNDSIKYLDKLNQLKIILKEIALTDTSISLVEQILNKE